MDTTFNVVLKCKNNAACDIQSREDWYLPPTLDPVDSDCSENFEGSFDEESSYEEVWQVPFRFYRLTKIKMWLWPDNTSGFTVTYNVPDDITFENWPELSHHFGY